MIYIGIDSSISSPSYCIYDGKKYTWIFFSGKKKHKDFHYKDDKYEIIWYNYPKFNKKTTDRIKLMDYMTDKLIDQIYYRNDDKFKVTVEQYAFSGSGKLTKLAEIMGITLHKLLKECQNIEINEVAPTSLKKWFTNNGSASKFEMYQQFYSMTKLDLLTMLKNKSKDIESPFEDMADAFAACCHAQDLKIEYNDVVSDIIDNMF
jgi:Holliday junction resolvasome RuvABC endonuclease subunit